MLNPPNNFSSWKSFYHSMQSSFQFEEEPGPNYDGTHYTWDYIKERVREEAGQHAPSDPFVIEKTFEFSEEGLLKLSLQPDKIAIVIAAHFTSKLPLGQASVTEHYSNSVAAERRFASFDRYQAELAMRQLYFAYSTGNAGK